MIHIIHIIDNFFINLSLNDLGVCLENVLDLSLNDLGVCLENVLVILEES